MARKNLTETADDRSVIMKHNYNEAMVQTISEEDFTALAIETMSQEWGQEGDSDDTHGVIVNLLETIDDAEVQNEVDFRLETDDVGLSGEGLGADPFEENRPNRYTIKGLLGKGAMGQVFAVLDNNFDREIAVKFLHPSASKSPGKMADFFREAKLTSKLEHPNILPIHDVNVSDGGLPYFSMRKAQGSSLRDVIDESTTDNPRKEIATFIDRASIIVKVCDAISYAHSQGIIHQDIKPANIMLGSYGEVVLVDWGTAKHQDESLDGKSRLLGTPVYMAPEQARRESSTELSDVYCLGATFFHLLTLRYPTWSDDADAFWELKKSGFVSELTETEERHVPAPLLSIAARAMSAHPGDRYQNVLEMRADIINYQRGLRVSAHNDTLWEIMKRGYRTNARVVWTAAASVGIIGILLYMVYVEIMKNESDWRVVYEDDFTTAGLVDLEDDWNGFTFYKYIQEDIVPVDLNSSSPWMIKDGAIHCDARGTGEQHYNLSFAREIPGDIRVEWDYTPLSKATSVNCFIGAGNRFEGYMFHISNDSSASYKYCTKGEVFVDQQKNGIAMELDTTYRFRMEKEGYFVRLFINDNLEIEIEDVDILRGPNHQTFGFETLKNHMRVDNVKISSRPLPLKVSPILVANSFFNDERYVEALESYKQIAHAYPGSDLDAIATYRIGRSQRELLQSDDALIAFNDFLYRFPEHPLLNSVRVDIASIYLHKQNWLQGERFLNKIASIGASRSVRRRSMSVVESALKGRIDFYNQRSAYMDDIIDQVDFVEEKRAMWSRLLDVELADVNNLSTRLPLFLMFRGYWDRVLHDYTKISYPWSAASIYRLRGEYEKIIALTDDIDLLAKEYERLGILDDQLAADLNNVVLCSRIYVRNNDLNSIQSEFPNNTLFLGTCAVRRGDYACALEQYGDLPEIRLQALMGLRRYGEVTHENFPQFTFEVKIAQVLNGEAEAIIADIELDHSSAYIKAVAWLMVRTRTTHAELYRIYREKMRSQRYLFSSKGADRDAFERFILPPFLDMLNQRDANELLTLDYTKLKELSPHKEMVLLSTAVNIIETGVVSERAHAVYYYTEYNEVLLEAMHHDYNGAYIQASALYKKYFESIFPHQRTVPSSFAQQRYHDLSQ